MNIAVKSSRMSADTAELLTTRVDANIASIRNAFKDRLFIATKCDDCILFDLGEEGSVVVDLKTGAITDTVQPGREPTLTLQTTAANLARCLNGKFDPRTQMFYGRMKYKGNLVCGIRLIDELVGKRFPRVEHYTDLPLPTPTTDWDLARGQLREHGYCIIKDAFTKEEITKIRIRLNEQAAAERAKDLAYLDGGAGASQERRGYRDGVAEVEEDPDAVPPNQRLWNMQNKGDEFLNMLSHPMIKEIFLDYLEEDKPLLSTFGSNIVGPGGEAQFLHGDQNSANPIPPFAVAVNSLICVDDFTKENGATVVVPGSHILERGLTPDNIYSTDGTVAAEAPAGSVIIFDARIWHGAGHNVTDKPRRGLTIMMCRSWARTNRNVVLVTHPETLAKVSDEMKGWFGYRVTNGLGAVQAEPEGALVGWNPDKLVLEMHADANAA
jgi:ectoine hydroxylase-related dioxygenase (phytanoyl-CoA dioxygenase family)/putative sterol carrier protein